MDKIKELHDEILAKVTEYYQLVHAPGQNAVFSAGKSRVNYAGRVFDEKELTNLVDSSLEFWLTYGRYSKEFETKLAAYLGVRFALLVNSGSSANLLAFAALTSPLLKERQVKRGDEVITVACGFPTTIAPVVQYGAVPVFVDVELGTANIDVEALEKAYSPKSKAVMIAHTLGNPFDIKKVKAFCDKYNLWLIEDNCDALGSKYDGKFTVNNEKCRSCKMCMRLGCPAITFVDGKAKIDATQCNGCGLCANVCPFGAIERGDE